MKLTRLGEPDEAEPDAAEMDLHHLISGNLAQAARSRSPLERHVEVRTSHHVQRAGMVLK